MKNKIRALMSHAVVKTDKDEFDVPIKKIMCTFSAAIFLFINFGLS